MGREEARPPERHWPVIYGNFSCVNQPTASRAISGELVRFYNPDDEVPFFSILGGIAIVVGIGLLLSVKPVLKLMRGVR